MLQELQSFYQHWKRELQHKINILSSEDLNQRLEIQYQELLNNTDTHWNGMFTECNITISRMDALIEANTVENSRYFYQLFIPLVSYTPQISHIIVQSPTFNRLNNNPFFIRKIIDESRFLQKHLNYLDPVTETDITYLLFKASNNHPEVTRLIHGLLGINHSNTGHIEDVEQLSTSLIVTHLGTDSYTENG